MTTLESVIMGAVPLGRFDVRLKLQTRANATGETNGVRAIFVIGDNSPSPHAQQASSRLSELRRGKKAAPSRMRCHYGIITLISEDLPISEIHGTAWGSVKIFYVFPGWHFKIVKTLRNLLNPCEIFGNVKNIRKSLNRHITWVHLKYFKNPSRHHLASFKISQNVFKSFKTN